MSVEHGHEVAIEFFKLLIAHVVFYWEVSLVLLFRHPVFDAVTQVYRLVVGCRVKFLLRLQVDGPAGLEESRESAGFFPDVGVLLMGL